MSVRQDLHVRQGETWSHEYIWNVDGSPVDLTGYSARMTVRSRLNAFAVASLTTDANTIGGTISLGGANGTITLSMTAAESTALKPAALTISDLSSKDEPPFTTFIYDLELVAPDDTVTRVLEGRVYLHAEVTR